MPLRPNRLFYWLPLLLFGWANPNLSAQTWTTVWTPGSVPATRAGTGSTNRYYNTNCYPCMMWDTYANNGKGKWEPMPLGTDPIRCKGDTNDYTCKICDDGLGGITNAPDYTICGTCGCCEDGTCVEHTNNCPNPPPTPTATFVKAGQCDCTDPNEGGCVTPMTIPVPMPEYSVCLKDCNWIPILEHIKINYNEGLCLNRCVNNIATNTDVTSANVCSVKQFLTNRIAAIMTPAPTTNSTSSPTNSLPTSTNLPPVLYCFTTCMQTHENIHYSQMVIEWQDFWNSIVMAIEMLDSIPFDCNTMRTAAQAEVAFHDKIYDITISEYFKFIAKWYAPDQKEAQAYFAEAQCLMGLLAQIQQMATNNNCP